MVVSHDLSVAAALCQKRAVIERGRIVEQGSTANALGSPEHPYTRKLRERPAPQPRRAPAVASALTNAGGLLAGRSRTSNWGSYPLAR
ncbi:hypothetical protein [Nonomuraea sp. CA-141351]|uniref:hypothetical protein n=1 Tax=Nonomuraea sp. CA-141351 TaxID=3239996 RepID=UPI003D8DF83A